MKRMLGWTRAVVVLGVVGSLLASVILFVNGLVQVVALTLQALPALGDATALKPLALAVINIVDYFLIATALYIVAIGLYELFIGTADMPAWLTIDSLDELKERLIGVVVTVLAVTFLGYAANWSGTDILQLGLALAAVIVALGLYGWLTHGRNGKH